MTRIHDDEIRDVERRIYLISKSFSNALSTDGSRALSAESNACARPMDPNVLILSLRVNILKSSKSSIFSFLSRDLKKKKFEKLPLSAEKFRFFVSSSELLLVFFASYLSTQKSFFSKSNFHIIFFFYLCDI